MQILNILIINIEFNCLCKKNINSIVNQFKISLKKIRKIFFLIMYIFVRNKIQYVLLHEKLLIRGNN